MIFISSSPRWESHSEKCCHCAMNYQGSIGCEALWMTGSILIQCQKVPHILVSVFVSQSITRLAIGGAWDMRVLLNVHLTNLTFSSLTKLHWNILVPFSDLVLGLLGSDVLQGVVVKFQQSFIRLAMLGCHLAGHQLQKILQWKEPCWAKLMVPVSWRFATSSSANTVICYEDWQL